MQANSFEYKTLDDERVIIKYDHAAITTGGGGKTDEPAWSFRLWNGSIYLSRYLETIASQLCGKTVIDLGSGTGLTSIVLGRCCGGAKKVYATDLSHAMPLLAHNININNILDTSLSIIDEAHSLSLLPQPPSIPTTTSEQQHEQRQPPTCPANHVLTLVTADCEDYMCNVCDFDIDENSCIHRCVECNFDICIKCITKIVEGKTDSFPDWFMLQLQSNASRKRSGVGIDTDTDQRVQPFVYDWSCSNSLQDLVNEVTTPNNGSEDICVQYLIGADVTYSMKSIDLFFSAVTNLTTALRHKCPSSTSSTGDITLLFAHHNRSDETNAYMLQQLDLFFDGKFVEVPFEALTRQDREDAEESEDTGTMQIFRVSL